MKGIFVVFVGNPGNRHPVTAGISVWSSGQEESPRRCGFIDWFVVPHFMVNLHSKVRTSPLGWNTLQQYALDNLRWATKIEKTKQIKKRTEPTIGENVTVWPSFLSATLI